MSANLSPNPKLQFWGTTGAFQGKPLVGGRLFTCMPGGTIADLKPTYTDYWGTAENPNPIRLDVNGMADIWLTGFYKFFLYDANGIQQYDVDNISGSSNSNDVSDLWKKQALTPIYISADTFAVVGDCGYLFPPGHRIRAELASSSIFGTIDLTNYNGEINQTNITCIWDAGYLAQTLSSISLSTIYESPSVLPIVPVSRQSSNYILKASDMGHMFLFNILTDSVVTLPNPAQMPSGTWFRIKNIGPAQLTINGKVNGIPNIKMGLMDEAFVYTDNSSWVGTFFPIGYPVEQTANKITIAPWRVDRTYLVSAEEITLPEASSVNSGGRLKIVSKNIQLTVKGMINNEPNVTLPPYGKIDLISDGSNWYGDNTLSKSLLIGNSVDGLQVRNNPDDSSLMDVSAGSCVDHSQTVVMYNFGIISKRVDQQWAYGSGMGGLDFPPSSTSNPGMFYVYIINTETQNAADVIFSRSSTGPNLPPDYIYFRLLGAFFVDGSHVCTGVYTGDYFYYSSGTFQTVCTFPKNMRGSQKIVATLNMVPNNVVGIILLRLSLKNSGGDIVEGASAKLTLGGSSALMTSMDDAEYIMVLLPQEYHIEVGRQ